jgi:hypothetical protein
MLCVVWKWEATESSGISKLALRALCSERTGFEMMQTKQIENRGGDYYFCAARSLALSACSPWGNVVEFLYSLNYIKRVRERRRWLPLLLHGRAAVFTLHARRVAASRAFHRGWLFYHEKLNKHVCGRAARANAT